jgi:4-hydroxy-tetrahydrodipicolinate synthase
MLSAAHFAGPWAGLPVSWHDDDTLDESTYREDVARCCQIGVPGVYTAGTTGEFYALDDREWDRVAQATVEVAQAHGTPVMLGVTATYTLGAVRRAARAAALGADAIQVALPFWMEVPDAQVVPFFRAVGEAAGGLAVSVYETTRCRKVLTLEQHAAIKAAVPEYQMVKANAGTLGASPDGCRQLSSLVSVFVGEHLWGSLCPHGARGGCSSIVYWNPRVILELWRRAEARDWDALAAGCERLTRLDEFLGARYAPLGFTDTAYDRMGARAFGFLQTSLRNRGPYVSPTATDVADLRQWCQEHLPEMLVL